MTMTEARLGLVLIFLSAFLFSLMGVFIKYASSVYNFPPTELVFLRAVSQGCIVILAMAFTKQDHHDNGDEIEINTSNKKEALIWQPFGKPSVRKLVIARGAVGGFGFVCFFYAIATLPLGDAMALLSLHPVVTVLAAALFLGETIRPSHVVAAVASGLGAMLITRPAFVFGSSSDDDPSRTSDDAFYVNNNIISPSDIDNTLVLPSSHADSMGYAAALVGTCCGSAVFCLMRAAGKSGAHTYQLVFSWAVFGIFFSVIIGMILRISGVDGAQPWYLPPVSSSSMGAWLCILGMCMFGSVAHFLLNYAARMAPAGLASITRSSEIIWGYSWEVLLFSQVPSKSTLEGVLLICLSIAIVQIQRAQDEKQQEHQTASTIREIEPDEESGDAFELNDNTNYGSTDAK